MKRIVPIARLGSSLLFINIDDIEKIGSKNALDITCVYVDTKKHYIAELSNLETHLKFNPWEEISNNHKEKYLNKVLSQFSQEEISNKIISPLLNT
jgi:hypothetical protein